MKCVCPMGGDRTCPDNCLLASWYNLPVDQRTKAQRQPRAEQMYKQGYTMEAIATQLGVAQSTITEDLRNLSTVDKSKPTKTASNPKGAGRPKGSRKPRAKQTDNKETEIVALHDAGKTSPQIASELGIEGRAVRHVIEREHIKRTTEPTIDRSELSMTAQNKLDAAIRQYKAKLDAGFAVAVDERVRQRIDEIVLPSWKQKVDQAQQLYARRKGLMDKDTFNTIRRALHPDSRQSISDHKLGEAFDTFMRLEKYLLNEKDSPTDLPNVPDNLAAWDKMKREETAARRARRTMNRAALRRRA